MACGHQQFSCIFGPRRIAVLCVK